MLESLRRKRILARSLATVGIATIILLLTTASPLKAAEDKVDELVQEVFLGQTVYPQDAGEVQITAASFWAYKGRHDHQIPLEFEYGITDYLQVQLELPFNFHHTSDDRAQGLGNVAVGVGWNVLNCPESGWAASIGYEIGLPEATTGAGENAFIHEPFFVAYREFDCLAINFSATLEVEDPRERGEETTVASELAVAMIKPSSRYDFTYLLEFGVEVEEDATEAKLAPGMYWQPHWAIWEFGVSLPIGLTEDTPDIGVFALFTLEFGGDDDEGNDDSFDESLLVDDD